MATASIRIPGTLEDLTAPWLTDALRSSETIGPQTEVSSLSWSLLGEGQGFLGDLARIEIEYDGPPGPATAVVKIPTAKPQNRGLGIIFSSYQNEGRFYEELASHTATRLPRCYFSGIEHEPRSAAIVSRVLAALPERVTLWLLDRLVSEAGKSDRRFILLLEDLGEARIGDQVVGATLPEARVAVEMLAEFHAAYWESPLLGRPWIVSQSDQPLVVHGIFERAYPVFANRYADLIEPPTQKVIDWVRANGPRLLKRIGAGPLTLVHGDYRMDNLFFYDGEEPPGGMIDFQAVGAGHPLTDLAYFLRPNLDRGDFAAGEDELLRLYHRALNRAGVTGYSWDEMLADYELAQLWVLHRGVILIGTLDLSHERGVHIVDQALTRTLRDTALIDPERAMA